jgi:hypothetical protein
LLVLYKLSQLTTTQKANRMISNEGKLTDPKAIKTTQSQAQNNKAQASCRQQNAQSRKGVSAPANTCCLEALVSSARKSGTCNPD